MIHSFIELPTQDNCDCSLDDDGVYPKYLTRQDIILIGRSDLVDNITNTATVKPGCYFKAFIINVKIMGSLFFGRKILWCFPAISLPVYLPTS